MNHRKVELVGRRPAWSNGSIRILRAAAIGLIGLSTTVHASLAQDASGDDSENIGLVIQFDATTTRGIATDGGNTRDLVMEICDNKGKVLSRFLDMVYPHYDCGVDRWLPAETTAETYTVYLKKDRMRLQTGTSAMLAALAPDGSAAEWAVLDPSTGRVVGTDVLAAGLNVNRWNPSGEVEVEDVTVGPAAGGTTRQIVGQLAQPYHFAYTVTQFPMGRGEGAPKVVTKVDGHAWLAESGDYAGDSRLRAFFRNFAQTIGDQAPGGSPSELARLHDYGLMLADSITAHAFLELKADERHGLTLPVIESTSTSVVTSISRQPLDDTMFAGFERAEQECDCSCGAFEELKKLEEDDPNALGKAMCATECTMKWVRECVREIQ